jgi:hypothetical protein
MLDSCNTLFPPVVLQPNMGHALFVLHLSVSHNSIQQIVGLVQMSDQLTTEIST